MADSGIPPPATPHPTTISDGYRTFIGVTCMMTLLSTVCVAFRFAARRITVDIAWDDWFALIALVFAFGFLCTTVIVATVGGAGYPITEYSAEQLVPYFKIVLGNNVIYNCSITASKISILLFYRRIFTNKPFRLASTIMMGVCTANFIGTVFALIFAYTPVETQWEFWLPHKSIDNQKFWLVAGIINVILDTIILTMPQKYIWSLHQPIRRKILMSGIFLLGGFVVVTSILRIISLLTVNFVDFTETLTTAGIWTMTEMNMSIVCACLPTLPALFRSWWDGTLPHGKRRDGYTFQSMYVWIRRQTTRDGSRGTALSTNKSRDDSIQLGDRDDMFKGGSHTTDCYKADSYSRSSSSANGIGVRHEIDISVAPVVAETLPK